MKDILPGREVLFETKAIGNAVRVAAMDAVSATEIVISCPKGTPEGHMQMMALKRLEFVLRKNGIIS